LTLIHADKEKRDRNNSYPNRFEIIYLSRPSQPAVKQIFHNRKDAIMKEELYRQHIEGKYNIKFVLDDRQQVVDMWRGLGLTVFQVDEGDF
jgi:hypothetical protein